MRQQSTPNNGTPCGKYLIKFDTPIESTFIGIAKDELVVHVLPANTQLIVPNSIKGFRQLSKLFKEYPPQQILCEVTGGLERLLVAHLAAEGLPIVIVNLRQARDVRD